MGRDAEHPRVALPASPAGWTATCSLGAFVTCVSAATALHLSFALALVTILLSAAVMLVAALSLPSHLRAVRKAVVLSEAAIILGLLRGAAAAAPAASDSVTAHLGHRPLVAFGQVADSIAAGPADGTVVELDRVVEGDSDHPIRGTILVPAQRGRVVSLRPGSSVRVEASGLVAPGLRPGPRSEEALAHKGIDALASGAQISRISSPGLTLGGALDALRSAVITAVESTVSPPAAALVLGIAFGIRRPLGSADTAALQDSGLFHIVVVSGLKVIIVAGTLRAMAGALGWSRRRTLLLTGTLVGGYVLLSGAGPAAVRSAVMALLAACARGAGRRADPLPLLALIAAAMVALDPRIYADAGFQLSFLGTAGILLLADPIARHLPGPRLLTEPFAVTVAAQAATFPVMADTFGVISLVGPLANAVVLPLLPAFIVLGAVGALAGAVNAHLGWLPLQLAGLGSSLVLAVAHLSAGVRGAAVHVGRWPWQWTVAEVAGVAAATTFFFVFRKRRPSLSPSLLRALLVGLVTAGLVVHLTAGADGRLHLDVLDVGPAPAVLVSAPAGRLMLVDGGADPTRLSTALGRVLSPLQRSLDLVVLTSTDRQAAAGLVGLEERYQVRRLLTPAQLNSASRDIADRYEKQGAAVVPEDGAGWDWDGTVLRCLRVDAESGSHCALHVADGGESALLLGTMGPQDQDQLPALFGTSLRAGLLVVPNPVGVSALLLDAVRPRLIASAAGTAGAAAALPSGVVSASTARDGDLRYSSGARGWERD